jgi:hypothetical protein
VCDLQSNVVAFDHDHHRAVDDDHVLQAPDSSLSLSLSLSLSRKS